MRPRVLACLGAGAALCVVCLSVGIVLSLHLRREASRRDLFVIREACEDLQRGSNRLTEHVRRFVELDGCEAERDAYFAEVKDDRHRELAMRRIANLRRRDLSVRCLQEAMELSLSLMLKECHAMRLLTREERLPFAPPELREFRLTDEECVLTWNERRARAREEVFGKGYADYKDGIGRWISEALARTRKEECR